MMATGTTCLGNDSVLRGAFATPLGWPQSITYYNKAAIHAATDTPAETSDPQPLRIVQVPAVDMAQRGTCYFNGITVSTSAQGETTNHFTCCL